MVTRRSRTLLARLCALALAACAALALALAACEPEAAEPDEPLTLSLDDKARVTIDAEISTTKLTNAGLQALWVRESSGWDPCPEMLSTEFPPETCWIRVLISETQIAVLLPAPDGSLGPYGIPVHFDVFDFEPGEYEVWLIQVGRLELRHTEASPLQIEPPAEAPSA